MPPSPSELPPDTRLYRRIARGAWSLEHDRPHSTEFRLRPGELGLSFFLASECSVEEVLRGHDGFGLVELTVADLEEFGLVVIRSPDPDNPLIGHAHAEARIDDPAVRRIPGSVRRELARRAALRIIRRPDMPFAEPQ